jgi:hypothetical protein
LEKKTVFKKKIYVFVYILLSPFTSSLECRHKTADKAVGLQMPSNTQALDG